MIREWAGVSLWRVVHATRTTAVAGVLPDYARAAARRDALDLLEARH
jgi:hypothetical protein